MRRCKFNIHKIIGGKMIYAEMTGYFHEWSSSFEEFESGPAQFPVAIVEETGTGKVFTPYACDVTFIDPYEERHVHERDAFTSLEDMIKRTKCEAGIIHEEDKYGTIQQETQGSGI